jgi:hypothetical protein
MCTFLRDPGNWYCNAGVGPTPSTYILQNSLPKEFYGKGTRNKVINHPPFFVQVTSPHGCHFSLALFVLPPTQIVETLAH